MLLPNLSTLTTLLHGILFTLLASGTALANEPQLPDGFTYLRRIAPNISQDIRYAGDHNFVGRPIAGYDSGECVLTNRAAAALAAAAAELEASGLGLHVYDCYRPARAVADFVRWARDIDAKAMQAEFYPRVDKTKLFELGYIAEKSGHSRGSTIDVTIVRLGETRSGTAPTSPTRLDCASADRFDEGDLDFGTSYDCFDLQAHHGADGVDPEAAANREMLAGVLDRHGFDRYQEEWWHYTLRNEPFPDTYFDFPIEAPRQ